MKNGKIYVGAHKTDDINDNYMGSGKYLRNAIAKHGVEQFKKKILHELSSEDEMFGKETEIVTEEFLSRDDTYNLKLGGLGGFNYINENNLSPAGTPDYIEKYRSAFVIGGKKIGAKNLEEARIEGILLGFNKK